MKRILATLALVALTACSSLGITPPPAPKSPAQTVFELKAAEGAALALFVQYKALPSCAAPVHPVLCSDAVIVAKVQQADAVAAPAIDSAEAAVRTPGFGASAIQTSIISAQNAIAALTAITATLRTK